MKPNQKKRTAYGRLLQKILVFAACAILFNLARYHTLKLPLGAFQTYDSVDAPYLVRWSIASVPMNLVFGGVAAVEHLNEYALHEISYRSESGFDGAVPILRYSQRAFWAGLAREFRGITIKHLNVLDHSKTKSTAYNFSLNTLETMLTMPIGIVFGSVLTGLSAVEYSLQYGLATGDDEILNDIATGIVNMVLYVLCFIPYRIYRRRLRRADQLKNNENAQSRAKDQGEPDEYRA